MRDEIRKIQQLMEAADYVTDAPVATSVHLATTLRKPLLIEGHAGVGKTEIAKVMSAVESRLAGNGRLLIRYSGTEPLLRIMIEGQDQREISAWADEIADAVRQHLVAPV